MSENQFMTESYILFLRGIVFNQYPTWSKSAVFFLLRIIKKHFAVEYEERCVSYCSFLRPLSSVRKALAKPSAS